MAAENWTLDIYVRCEECGDWVEVYTISNKEEDKLLIDVYPCETCLKRAHDQGYDRGYEDGKEEATQS
jgi:hypothetical protein